LGVISNEAGVELCSDWSLAIDIRGGLGVGFCCFGVGNTPTGAALKSLRKLTKLTSSERM